MTHEYGEPITPEVIEAAVLTTLQLRNDARVQASQFAPSMSMAQDPQTPSRQERRKARVESTLFLIQMSASRTVGPQSARSTSNVSRRGLASDSAS